MIESSKKECPRCGWTLFQDETHFWCGNIHYRCEYSEDKGSELGETMSEKEIIEKVRWVFEENASDLLDSPADPELTDTVCEFGSALLGLDSPLYNLQELIRLVTKGRET